MTETELKNQPKGFPRAPRQKEPAGHSKAA